MAKNEFIKRPNALTEYTQENLDDLYRCASDPVHFAKKFIMVQHPKKGAIPLNLYDYQVRAIEGFLHNRWCIVKAGRQLGKCVFSTTIINTFTKPSGLKKILLKIFFKSDYDRIYNCNSKI